MIAAVETAASSKADGLRNALQLFVRHRDLLREAAIDREAWGGAGSHGPARDDPVAHREAFADPSPSSTIVPAISWPRVRGGVVETSSPSSVDIVWTSDPSRMCRSE
jgi:hypothetical protein